MIIKLPIRYDHIYIEKEIYYFWIKNNFFYAKPNNKSPYTIVLPPPNVTGILHMGHMMNSTIQDVLIRRARMKGHNSCWIPGTDHASIATESKLISHLNRENLLKNDLSRNEFFILAWDWVHHYNKLIIRQLQLLGCSCDWNRFSFTMDKTISKYVDKVFIDLYNKGIIYRKNMIVNWDTKIKTTISDEEVFYEDRKGMLFYIKYFIFGENRFIIVATTRPETIFGDTAVCVNPKDERYNHLIGKKVIVPIVGRIVPIIQDEYIEQNFGSGCIKVTPGHDKNDYKLACKYFLEPIDIFYDDGTINLNGYHFSGLSIGEARKKIINELKQFGVLLTTEYLIHQVGLSERTKTVIETKRSMQWFLNMKEIVTPAIDAVINDKINFYPSYLKNIYNNWMENIHDWNISRQLWWGHRIPVYYSKNNIKQYVIALNKQHALAILGVNQLELSDIIQEEYVLDTWFSSWIWPIAVFDGTYNTNNIYFQCFYPTNDIVTAPDILFFWVARMIIAGYTFIGKKPFLNVYFTGIIRDKKHNKMSKSLGNSPDPIQLIDKYGADGVRMGLLLSSKAGKDLLFDEALCLQGRNFVNKIWNAFRLINTWKGVQFLKLSTSSKLAIIWFKHKFYYTLEQIENSFKNYRFYDSINLTYNLVWNSFCSWYLEIIKPSKYKVISKELLNITIIYFEKILRLLHPYIPFISENIWQNIKKRVFKYFFLA
jgi:valyl-tRNA synthetase